MMMLSNVRYGSFMNFCYDKDDFGVDVEWHFFTALQHGTGRTNIRLARKVSLQNPYEEYIMILRCLDCCKDSFSHL